ncbi:MAG: hypothetical protein ACJ786_23300, partial [Catenulispora sp.]
MTGYPDSATHLADELVRAGHLLRAQLAWFREGLGMVKPGAQWGLPSVGEAEVAAYLAGDGTPPPLPEEVRA